jgi:tetratricopeptide (TPR) repeat protein
MDLSNVLNFTGGYLESEQLARDAMRIFRQELGEGNSMAVYAGVHLGEALRGQGRYAEAEALLLAAFKRFEVPKPVTAHWRRHALVGLYRLYQAQGRLDEAARYRALADSSR